MAASAAVNQGTDIVNYQSLDLAQLRAQIVGRHVLIATHGFNVDRAAGIACLSNWEGLLQLGGEAVFLGLLWPGDSVWLHGLDYPEEPRIADEAGELLAAFLDANFQPAGSISLVSHSLGARVVLQTSSKMHRRARRLIVMAGAIDDDCLDAEFRTAVANVGQISVLASSEDEVLATAFPLGNFLGGILTEGHPWCRAALGQCGPSRPWPRNFAAPFQIPDNWNFGHGDYLKVDGPPTPAIAAPVNVPPNGTPRPATHGWQEAWTAAFAATRFR